MFLQTLVSFLDIISHQLLVQARSQARFLQPHSDGFRCICGLSWAPFASAVCMTSDLSLLLSTTTENQSAKLLSQMFLSAQRNCSAGTHGSQSVLSLQHLQISAQRHSHTFLQSRLSMLLQALSPLFRRILPEHRQALLLSFSFSLRSHSAGAAISFMQDSASQQFSECFLLPAQLCSATSARFSSFLQASGMLFLLFTSRLRLFCRYGFFFSRATTCVHSCSMQ